MKQRARSVEWIDACIQTAREQTAAKLAALRKRRRRRARPRPPIDESDRKRSKLGRALERLQTARILRSWKRDAGVSRNLEELNRERSGSARLDALVAFTRADVKAQRYKKDSRIRELLATKLCAVGAPAGRRDLLERAEKLRQAGTRGWWGVRESDGSVVIRLRDRSGLIMLDPAESRERTAELIERVTPVLLMCAKQGYEIHKAVFSEPNIPAGSLEWGKQHLFRRFTRTMLERDSSGEEIPRHFHVRHNGRTLMVDNPARKFPEIVAAFAVQEDPLARSEHHWNTHLNVILVVDPGQCTPLDRELWPQDPDDPHQVKPDPASEIPGMFSWMKVAHVWGAQVEIRRLEARASSLRRQLLEVIKYSCKTVTEKSLEKFDQAVAGENDSHRPRPRQELELSGDPDQEPQERPAPAMIDWPDARVLEWIDANKGFRRVRAWGVLYKLGKIERAGDPDDGIRWLGRIWVSPFKVTLQGDFFDALSSSWLDTGGQVPVARRPPSSQHLPRDGPRSWNTEESDDAKAFR